MENWNKKGTLFQYMKPEEIEDQMRNGEGLYQMKIDPLDNTKVFLSGVLIEDFGSMCYVAEIEYTMSSSSMNTVVTPSPNVLREKFIFGSYHKLTKKVRIYQIKKKNATDVDFFSVGNTEFSRSISDMDSINEVITTRADFGFTAKDNRIVKMAVSLYQL
jgi:fructose-1,6-bisphosphatase/inositol monophosphatase family enzyme